MQRDKGLLAAWGVAVAAVLVACSQSLVSQAPVPEKPIVGANPQAGTLNATLWMRTSGEYRALCLQTYRLALDSLKRLKACAESEANDKPFAVILDLDETVLDNSLFQSGITIRGERFSDEAFNHWINEHRDDVALVPGSKAFVNGAAALGVRVHYITNRPETEREATIATLVRLGVDAGADVSKRLQMRGDTSLKDPRRAVVANENRVLMILGDNLADFSDEFNPKNFAKTEDPLAGRSQAVDKRNDKWGVEWIVLPNPVYGDWTKPIDWKDPRPFLLHRDRGVN